MKIKIKKDAIFEEGIIYLDKVALIFGESNSGKTQLLKKIYKEHHARETFRDYKERKTHFSSEESKNEKTFEEVKNIKWFIAKEPKLFRFIELNSFDSEWVKFSVDNFEFQENQINKALKNAGTKLSIELIRKVWKDHGSINGSVKGALVNYFVDGKKVSPSSLSDGYKMYASIALHCYLVYEKAEIILMDEPFNRMHHKLRMELLLWLETLNSKFIIVTHNVDLINQKTLLWVKYLKRNGATIVENSFNFELTKKESVFDFMGSVHKKLGTDDLRSVWTPENALIVEGASDFIYLTKNKEINCFLDSSNIKIIQANGKGNIRGLIDKLSGNSKKIIVLWDYDGDIEFNEKLKQQMEKRNIFYREEKIDTKIIPLNISSIRDGALDIEDLFFDKKVENKVIFALENSNSIPSDRVKLFINKIKDSII